MNTKRYLLAGTASVLFHSLVFSAIPNTMVMAMPVGTESTRVSLNLVSVPQQAPKPQIIAEAPAPTKAVKAKPKKEVKTEQKRLVKKPKVTEEQAVKQPVTKDIVKKATPKKKPSVVKKDTVKPAKKTTKPKEEMVSRADSQPKPEVKAQEAAGVNSPPQLVNKPNFSSTPSPVSYPKIAQRRALEGKVLFEVWIDSSGKQIKQILVKSSGTNVLDDAALAAIKRWQFSSYIVDGQAIAHRVHIPVRFKLD
ncbi:energy transducer TonB [Photobacterium sanguinicancri]|uniref:energy transducer TonB n=1 Tax=Photobacterium sanguinicancri TaxID=875932 RepID=UPI003D122745